MPGMTEVQSPTSPAPVDPVQAGRDAYLQHDWDEAFEQLSLADRQGKLSGADLEALALSAFFAAHADVQLDVLERAFQAYEAEANGVRAAFLGVQIAREYAFMGKPSIATIWARRAERIVGPEGESYPHGYMALIRSEAAAAAGDMDGALAMAERAVEIGEHAGDADLRASAQVNLGVLKIASGATTDGLLLMEEASMAAVNGELTPFTSGLTACRMIGACRDLTDYGRAREWIEATEKYCDRQSVSGFPGICRVHRSEVAAISGAWERAELELVQATADLEAYQAVPVQADGYYAIGDIRRLKGDLEGAEVALREAHARGRSPQPALALIRLAEGKVKAASTAINTAVAEQTWDHWARARLLPAQVEIAIAAGDVELARTAAVALSAIVAGYPSPALEAGSQVASGRVLLADGDAAGATRAMRAAIKGWREVGAPYEVARVQTLLSRTLRAQSNEDGADLELAAALAEFRRLGARLDIEAVEREQGTAEERRSGPQTARKTFMFTDIVGSTTLAEALGDEAWERILRWHDDTLRDLVKRGGGEVINTTGDGFFAAFDSAGAGVDCAISIQRALVEHRVRTGFAPPVRIGLHTAIANQRGSDYSGIGVHVAARVSALAAGGEILASAETLAEAGGATTEARSVSVKGVSEAVSLAAIAWA